MYINFKLASDRGLTPTQVLALQAIKQNRIEDTSDVIEKLIGLDVSFFEDNGLVTFIKPKNKKDFRLKLIRLSNRGSQLLDDIETPKIQEEDLKIFEWLKKMYLEMGKDLGNQKMTKMYIALFRINSGIKRNALAKLCNDFISDADNMTYSHVLEYVFFKSPSAYKNSFDLEYSKLWRFYQKNKAYYDNLFTQELYLK